MQSLRGLVAIAVVALCLLVQAEAKELPEMILKRLPQTLGGCGRGEARDYGNPRLGWSVAYNSDGVVITVYAYDQGHEHIADGIADQAIRDSFTMARKDIQIAAAKGMYSDVEDRSEGKETYEGMEMLYARYRFTFAQGKVVGVRAASEIHIFGVRDHIIKIRVTAALQDGATLEKVMEEFIPALVKAIQNP
ncbi:hypothetical protein CfE428DRAFT_4601 [Chthoniobacter flavus Ellin428]|uniref:Uncharacterized protein n=1 Tax=Chthoniobacter flavus Ellin428 TaxID=497964 RepID=B4D6R1_9BACT|nr:hypothetical protein [Chthoniobacter flavus]EDY17862.1 hypothetical protein CfE428DRAFT_4601 [Chthoniobacter flavus Ellin428]TCO88473.1 hypothetical protein EV701_11775 [Chthoniobacter flavus]